MKLELKHLAPYLPYGLKMEIQDFYNGKKEIARFTGSHIGFSWDENTFINCKPILRPLSDLNNEIEHNGERFIPLIEINTQSNEFGLTYYVDDLSDGLYLMVKQDKNIHINYLVIPMEVMNLLFEWHFDVFGLIEQGLAIDINTLKI